MTYAFVFSVYMYNLDKIYVIVDYFAYIKLFTNSNKAEINNRFLLDSSRYISLLKKGEISGYSKPISNSFMM